MAQYKSPVERSTFLIVEKKDFGRYVLLSEKYKKRFELHINWLENDSLEPAVGDELELPDSMLYEDIGRPIFSNHVLSFGLPYDDVAFPESFNIEEDYAYLTYKRTSKRILIQRFYG